MTTSLAKPIALGELGFPSHQPQPFWYAPAYRSAVIMSSMTASARARVLTGAHPIKPIHPAAVPQDGLIPADALLIDAEILFRQPEPVPDILL
jgi:hypothetical protein